MVANLFVVGDDNQALADRLREQQTVKRILNTTWTLYHFWYILEFGEASGAPVLDWLRGLDKDDRHAIGLDLMRVQFGWPIGRPLVRSLKDGLWEVRSSLPSQRLRMTWP